MRIAVAGSTGMVGSRFVVAASARGHQVRGMSRSEGVDLFSGIGVHEALAGADVVVDLTRSPTYVEEEATHFYRRTSVILGRAAQQAGIRRSVVLSVIGCDRVASARDAGFGLAGYYRAKFQHERATKEEAPDPHVLRSAQLFPFVGQEVERCRVGPRVSLLDDLLIQPVDLGDVVPALLDLATGEDDRPEVQVAGPRPERLVDLAQQYLRHQSDDTEIEPLAMGPQVRDGILLPPYGTDMVGPSYTDWLQGQPAPLRMPVT